MSRDNLRLQCLMLLYIHRDCKEYWGRGAHDGNLDFQFHTAPELWVSRRLVSL